MSAILINSNPLQYSKFRLSINNNWVLNFNMSNLDFSEEIYGTIPKKSGTSSNASLSTATKCLNCQKTFSSRDRIVNILVGKPCHIHCWNCSLCGNALPTEIDGDFQYSGEKLYCADCGHSCDHCHESIQGEYMMLENRAYHKHCLHCAHCSNEVRKDDYYFLDEVGNWDSQLSVM